MEWISVKDRLPEIKDRGVRMNPCSDEVLAFNGKQMFTAHRFMVGNCEHFSGQDNEIFNEPTHWMQLPEPPKEI